MNSNTFASRAWQHRAGELGDRLPRGLTIGTATSAFQVEGGARDGGRGESSWDVFTRQQGRILDGQNASISADHIGNLTDDVTLLRELGADLYSFSFAWPRLQPDARGALNRAGLAFYDRLLDQLLGNGISAMATLSHWDLPLALKGGWLNRDTAMRFGDYAHQMGEIFGDRIDAWVTLNDPATVTLNGYLTGVHAPGQALLFDALPAAHHQLLGHGVAVQGLRAADVRGGIGIRNQHTPVQPSTDREADRDAAELLDLLHNRLFADPVLLGRYPDPGGVFESELRYLHETDPDDLRTIHQPLDFYGVGYTQPSRVAAGAAGPVSAQPGTDTADMPVRTLPLHLEAYREHPVTGSGVPNAPEYLPVLLADLRDRYADLLPPVYLTVGASYPDRADVRGAVTDLARIDYLAEHLVAAAEAVAPGGPAEGVALRGVLIWSLLDSFEWTAGYTQRFGLVAVDFTDPSRPRTPKQSYRWLQQVLSNR
ncbi:glycoside hydrolase family 1 protein [Cryobacterium sp.]|jgi:beta-glucosidase|uniref:glycoside hydrolase family 1 protein n=1 Tax=Cryobacterium sp. TaxID=1926290 RepID=UPI0026156ECB|nr:family 1 glycosylhydrolase [Cryobacterium sp.]MCU1444377.1 beta-glucosidase [Cryobacterium sp.]